MLTDEAASGVSQLFALMYSSDAAVEVDQSLLDDILHRAREKNARLDVSGILLFRGGRFFQYLEGSEAAVRDLYREIAADPRHSNVRVLLEATPSDRRFSAWTMGYEPLRSAATEVPDGFRSTFADLEDAERPENVLRAVTELTYWYLARAVRNRR